MDSFEYFIPAIREIVLVDVVLGDVGLKIAHVCLEDLYGVPEFFEEPATDDADDRQHGVD
jgi:hypothetical protein